MSQLQVQTFALNSQHAVGRREEKTDKVLNDDTNLCEWFVRTKLNDVVAVSCSNVELGGRIPCLKPTERTLTYEYSDTGTHLNPVTVSIQLPAKTGPTVLANYHEYAGSCQPLLGFLEMLNLALAAQTVPVLQINNHTTSGILSYEGTDAAFDVRILDTPFARLMGYRSFPTTYRANGVNGYEEKQASHKYRRPVLYLHMFHVSMRTERDGKLENIIYKCTWPGVDVNHGNNARPWLDKYVDDTRNAVPIELIRKGETINSIKLGWFYDDGKQADLGGEEWSCMFEGIMRPRSHAGLR